MKTKYLTKVIGIRLPEELHKKTYEFAEARNLGVSSFIRELIQDTVLGPDPLKNKNRKRKASK